MDEWYLLTAIYDTENSLIKLYVNGIFNNELSASLNKPVNPRLEIGRNPWPESYHHGVIDDIRIYNRVLAGNEIQSLYYEGTGNYTYLWSTGDTTSTISVSPTVTTTYYVEITDGINWCTDSVTVTVEHAVELELKAFLEGPFLNGSMITYLNLLGFMPLNQPYNQPPWNYNGNETVSTIPTFVTDWVLVELRETVGDVTTATSDKIVFRKACFIQNDGNIIDLDGSYPITINAEFENNVYIVLWHRNHLPVISAYPLEYNAGIYHYDFTTFAEQVYGGELSSVEVGIDVWGLASGDGNNNKEIDNLDKNDIWLPNNGNMGYYIGDYNLDGQVNSSDKVIKWEPNAGKGSKIPD